VMPRPGSVVAAIRSPLVRLARASASARRKPTGGAERLVSADMIPVGNGRAKRFWRCRKIAAALAAAVGAPTWSTTSARTRATWACSGIGRTGRQRTGAAIRARPRAARVASEIPVMTAEAFCHRGRILRGKSVIGRGLLYGIGCCFEGSAARIEAYHGR